MVPLPRHTMMRTNSNFGGLFHHRHMYSSWRPALDCRSSITISHPPKRSKNFCQLLMNIDHCSMSSSRPPSIVIQIPCYDMLLLHLSFDCSQFGTWDHLQSSRVHLKRIYCSLKECIFLFLEVPVQVCLQRCLGTWTRLQSLAGLLHLSQGQCSLARRFWKRQSWSKFSRRSELDLADDDRSQYMINEWLNRVLSSW